MPDDMSHVVWELLKRMEKTLDYMAGKIDGLNTMLASKASEADLRSLRHDFRNMQTAQVARDLEMKQLSTNVEAVSGDVTAMRSEMVALKGDADRETAVEQYRGALEEQQSDWKKFRLQLAVPSVVAIVIAVIGLLNS